MVYVYRNWTATEIVEHFAQSMEKSAVVRCGNSPATNVRVTLLRALKRNHIGGIGTSTKGCEDGTVRLYRKY